MNRILVAEDDPHILRLISMWLKRQGHHVVEARNGLVARDQLQEEPADILVSDVNMPGMDGIELVEFAVHERRVRNGIIVLTNRWDHGEIRDKLSAWGVHVLPKPFSPSKLSDRVDQLLHEDQVSPSAESP